jgi:hypothetical protein
MKVFRELCIHGTSDQVAAMMQNVEKSLTAGWNRNAGMEDSFQRINPQETVYCFTCCEEESRPQATLFLTEKEPGLVQVSNVVPEVTPPLTYDEYNAILEEFNARFIQPAAQKAGVTVQLTSPWADLEDWMSPLAATKLRFFARAAHKSTGSSHPSDQTRWFDFLLTAHRDGCTLSSGNLMRWLVEEANWSSEVASRMAGEYEVCREFLAFAEGSKRSA